MILKCAKHGIVYEFVMGPRSGCSSCAAEQRSVMAASFGIDHQKGCGKYEWNVSAEVAQIEEPMLAAGNFLVKITISCAYCGLTLSAADDGKIKPYLETVMYPWP